VCFFVEAFLKHLGERFDFPNAKQSFLGNRVQEFGVCRKVQRTWYVMVLALGSKENIFVIVG
jgi:hypothetical protein